MRISTKLILYLVSAVIVVMTVYALFTLSRTQERLHAEMVKMGDHLGMALSVGLAHHLAAGDTAGVANQLSSVARYEDVAGAVVLDLRGRVMAASSPEAAVALADSSLALAKASRSSGLSTYRRERTIYAANGVPLGTLRLALTGQSLVAGVIQTRNHILITILALTAVLSSLIILFSRRYLVAPLGELSAGAEALGQGELHRRIHLHGDRTSELAVVAAAFNGMASSLEAREREIIREREYIRSIVNSVAEGIVVVDGQTRVTVWNETMHQRYHLSTTDVLGRPIGELFPELGTGELGDRMRDLLHGGTSIQVMQLRLAVDAGHSLSLTATPRRDAAGVVDGAVLVLTDITARLELEQRMQQSQKLAVAGQLAAGIAHEIGTPLNVISGSAEYLRMGLDEQDSHREELGIIVEEVGRISELVRQLMAFARQQDPVVEDVDLADVVDSVVRLMQGQLQRKGVKLDVHLAEDLPLLQADGGQLQQVLLNLVMNAWQAMPNGGGIAIRVARAAPPRAVDPAGDWLALSVRDTGSGIDPRDLPHVFEPFFTTKDVGEGTGLGLSILQRIVENHGGSVTAVSEPGNGSTFTVFLPVALSQRGHAHG